jgi:hypothetical protein
MDNSVINMNMEICDPDHMDEYHVSSSGFLYQIETIITITF